MGDEVVLNAVDPLVTSVPEFVAKAIPLMVAASLTCRMTAELLLIVASRFRSAEAGKAAAVLADFADRTAKVVGWFGGGMPKALVMERAEKIAMKELDAVKDLPKP